MDYRVLTSLYGSFIEDDHLREYRTIFSVKKRFTDIVYNQLFYYILIESFLSTRVLHSRTVCSCTVLNVKRQAKLSVSMGLDQKLH